MLCIASRRRQVRIVWGCPRCLCRTRRTGRMPCPKTYRLLIAAVAFSTWNTVKLLSNKDSDRSSAQSDTVRAIALRYLPGNLS